MQCMELSMLWAGDQFYWFWLLFLANEDFKDSISEYRYYLLYSHVNGQCRTRSRSTADSRLLQVNEFVKRVRAAKIHILLMGHLRKQLPSMFGKNKAVDKVLANLPDHFNAVRVNGICLLMWLWLPRKVILDLTRCLACEGSGSTSNSRT